MYLQHALAYYDQIERPDAFHLQQKGRALYELGRLEAAEAVLEPLVARDDQAFGRYWLSKVRLARGDGTRALALIDDALDRLPDGSRARRYRATFLEQRYAARRALGLPNAVEDLVRAHDEAADPRSRSHLAAKLAELG